MRGSPPYTWGALQGLAASSASIRITPIYMGSTRTLSPACRSLQDHPHIHGEHNLVRREFGTMKGSPPYTWGALKGQVVEGNVFGITPIYMGSTRLSLTKQRFRQDHPHIHGEHVDVHTKTIVSPGSPPYTWGAQYLILTAELGVRITPIYMGSTLNEYH